MDFSKLENIIFVAATSATALLLLIMTFYVISKGRRKTSGLDIFLRILSVIALIASAGLLTLAVFTDLTGGFRIAVAGDKAFFVAGGGMTELPMGALFVTLSTSTGHAIAVGLLIISLMALVADCMLAKRKYESKKAAVKKSPEQIKRDAELERIRKLSDAAVKKTSSAASASEKSQAHAPEVDDKKQNDDAPEFDWRVEAPAEAKGEFVGISKSETDDAFDSFDDFDAPADGERDIAEADGAQNAEERGAEQYAPPVDGENEPDTAADYEKPWYEQDDTADESIIAQALADEPREQNVEEHVVKTEPEEQESYDAPEPEPEEQEVYAEPETDDRSEEQEVYSEPETDENGEDDGYAEPRADERSEEQEGYVEPEYGDQDEVDYDESEPDRNFYIPKIRTVTRAPRAESQAPAKARDDRQSPAKAPAKKPSAGDKNTSRKPVSAQKSGATAKKPAQKQTNKTAKPQAKTDPRNLPVTRRYVILDRTNAVNIFSNYLKEREQAEKDRLESSINTIIIK